MKKSIVIKNKQLAKTIFGFEVEYVDFDVSSKINQNGGEILFIPQKQVRYE